MTRFTVSLLVFLGEFIVVMAGQAHAGPYPAGDAEKGAKVFRKCVSCHMIGDKAKKPRRPASQQYYRARNCGAGRLPLFKSHESPCRKRTRMV